MTDAAQPVKTLKIPSLAMPAADSQSPDAASRPASAESPPPPRSGISPTAGVDDARTPAPKRIAAASPPPPPADPRVELPKVCRLCGERYPDDFRVCPRDATPLESAVVGDDPFIGKVLGETYEIARLVGEGGMGRVYEARHLRLKDRRFAVKVLHPELARQPDIVARFQREAESASSIGHPNVVDVYDVHKTPDGVPYLVGEFLEGEELGAFIKRAPKLSPSVAVAIARQVCKALAAAHARGIVHRDMKPDNVFLVERDGVPVVKVLDFGISKAGSGDTHLTRTGMIMGTPSYMAPEQARGESVDLRADVYAIGALLYHALTGERPFDSDDVAATLNMVLTEEPPRPRSLSPEVPEALELVIQRAMAKDVRERYQTTAELDDALAPFDTGVGANAASQDGPPSPAKTLVAARRGGGGHPARGIRATALTMVAGIAATQGSGELASREARHARPTIVLAGIGLAVALVGGAVDGIGGLVRYLNGVELTATEGLLLFFGIVLIVATPAVIFVRRVKRVVWPNSVKAIELAADLKRIAIAALVTYGSLALTVRAIFTVLLRDSRSLAEGPIDAWVFAASALAAITAGALGPLARTIRRNANE